MIRKIFMSLGAAIVAAGLLFVAGHDSKAQTGGGNFQVLTGTATLTIVGCTTSPTTTLTWIKLGTGGSGAAAGRSVVVASVAPIACTSNSTGLSFTGYPTNILCFGSCEPIAIGTATNNGAIVTGAAVSAPFSSTLTLTLNGSASGWTNAAANKGIQGFEITYSTQ